MTEKIFTVEDAIDAVEREEYDDYNNRFVNAYARDGKLVVELEVLDDTGDSWKCSQRFVFTGQEENLQKDSQSEEEVSG